MEGLVYTLQVAWPLGNDSDLGNDSELADLFLFGLQFNFKKLKNKILVQWKLDLADTNLSI